MNTKQTYFNKKMPDPNLGIDIFLADQFIKGRRFKTHWHENMQFYYFIEGQALVECSQYTYQVTAGDLIVVNNNELHALESLSNTLKFYTIRFDSSFLYSHQTDLYQAKFLASLSQGQINFKHLIRNDDDIINCIHEMISEHSSKRMAYELAIKSSTLRLIVLLLRTYIHKQLSPQEVTTKLNNLNRFQIIFDFIESNYSNKITTDELSNLIHVTPLLFLQTI